MRLTHQPISKYGCLRTPEVGKMQRKEKREKERKKERKKEKQALVRSATPFADWERLTPQPKK